MNMILYGLMVFIVLCIFFIWYISTFNKFQTYIIRINEAEANIDSVLRKRFDLLNKSITVIKSSIEFESETLESITNLRSKKLSNFALDRELYEYINEFHTIRDQHESLKESESFTKIDLSITESESEIIALRKYYNDIITEYNKLVRSFPSNIVASFSKFKEKTYFDGKNMNDDILNDFKL